MTPQDFKTTLFRVFIVIFVVTATITLLGVLGVIPIKDFYLNTLFTTLVVELVGAVIALFRSAKFFEADPADKTGASTKPPEKIVPEVSQEFFVGRWRVEQAFAEVSGATVMDYQADGRFVGMSENFVGAEGRKERITGNWHIQKIAANKFILNVSFDDQRPAFQGTFKIFDQDHIHNTDLNYIATRSE